MQERTGFLLYNIEESMLITHCRGIQRNEENERCNHSHYATQHAHVALSRYVEE